MGWPVVKGDAPRSCPLTDYTACTCQSEGHGPFCFLRPHHLAVTFSFFIIVPGLSASNSSERSGGMRRAWRGALGTSFIFLVHRTQPVLSAEGFTLRSDLRSDKSIHREFVYASEDIKLTLAEHNVYLLPQPPMPPLYAAKGTEFEDLTTEKDFFHGPSRIPAFPADWCLDVGQEPRYTSENGSVMLNGHPLYLKGLNWYGFEGELFVLDGLAVWSPERFMSFLASHRFNALRLPFSLEWLARGLDSPLANIYVVQEDMRGLTQGQVMDRIFDAAAAQGILILLDLHVISVEKGITDLWYDETADGALVLDLWTLLLRRFAGRWNLLGIDLKNEPHGIASWGHGHPKTDWNAFATKSIQTLAARVPDFQGVFFVEGVERPRWNSPHAYWWGGNLEGVRKYPISTGSEDLDRRVVYSPHIYGPEVFPRHRYFQDSRFPDNMPGIWDHQFGWIEKSTYRAVVLGEWGGSIVGDRKAAANQQKLAEWLVHACIPDNFWWCLNPATEFNGGLLARDYQAVDKNVLQMLHYVQPKPTAFHGGIGAADPLCVVDGAFANARCAVKMGLPISTSMADLKAEKERQP